MFAHCICTLHTAHCSLYTAYCTLYTAKCRLQTADCTLHTADCRLQTTQCTLHTASCTLQTEHCTLTTAHNPLQISHPQWTSNTKHFTLCTHFLHNAYTLHTLPVHVSGQPRKCRNLLLGTNRLCGKSLVLPYLIQFNILFVTSIHFFYVFSTFLSFSKSFPHPLP